MPHRFGPQTISQQDDEACAREAIRIIGTVQPHGFVLVVDISTARIIQLSSGIANHWPGLEQASQLLERPLSDWVCGLGNDPTALLESLPYTSPAPLPLQPRVIGTQDASHPVSERFECVGHRVGALAVLEWQSLGEARPPAGEQDALIAAASAMFRLRSARSLEDFYEDCVREVSRLSGYDRVMMYRFLPDWTGEVLAEEVVGELKPLFLGMRFPASDIPSQARALYTESTIRVLADVKATPDTLIPALLPDGRPLDQSQCTLRGFSAVHRTYLGNMGVRATMSLSIVCNGKLWGLMACHHYEPRVSGYSLRGALRKVCELVAGVIALRIEVLEQSAMARETVALDQLFTELQQAVVNDEDTKAVISRMEPRLLAAFQASALCVRVGDWGYVGGRTGSAAPHEEILQEVGALFGDTSVSSTVLQLDDLLDSDRGLHALPEAAGLLAVRRPQWPLEICAFTRREMVQEVSWAGEPLKVVITEDDGRVRLEPRRSFSLWREKVAGTARAWSSTEVIACERILRIVSDACRHHAEKAAEQQVRYLSHLDHLASVQHANMNLEREVGVRIQVEGDLRRVNETLEIRVAERTSQSEALNRTLVEEGERFDIAADAAGLGFWGLDFRTGLVDWDERMFRLFGLPPMQGEQPYALWAGSLHPDDRARAERESADANKGMLSYDTQYRVVHPNGAIRHLKSAGRITRDTQGQAIRMSGVTFDITERKHADEQFRQAIEAAPTGMLLMNIDGSIVLVNAQIEILFGYPRTELLGQPIEMLIPERFRLPNPDFRNEFFRAARVDATVDGAELYGLRKDGSEVPIDIGLTPLHTSEGEFVLSSILDLSQRLEMDRIRSEFVSTVSHELRTPLTSISGALGLLESGAMGRLPDAAAEMVRIAYKNSGRLARLINDILDVGTLEAGKANLKMARVRLPELIRQSIEANLIYAEKFQVRFVLDEGLINHEVVADPDRLTQVLTNLLSNAAKFSPVGADVFIRVRTVGTMIRVEVEDHGPGISDDFRDRIFEKFAQADSSASRRFEGTGLGLSIARKLIEAMAGTIGFTTVVGQGTTFYLDLPRADSARIAHERGRHPETANPMPQIWDALEEMAEKALPKILYVEDDDDLVTVIRVTLAGRAHIIAAYNLREAEVLLREDTYDLIILDQSLPDGNGIDLVDRIPGLIGHAVPIVVLSAADVPNEMHRKVAAALAKTKVSAAQVATTILSYLPVTH